MKCKNCGGILDEYGDCPYCGAKRVRVRNDDVVRYININGNEIGICATAKVPMDAFNSEYGKDYIRKTLAKNLAEEILKNEDLLCNTNIETDPMDMTIKIAKRIRLVKI